MNRFNKSKYVSFRPYLEHTKDHGVKTLILHKSKTKDKIDKAIFPIISLFFHSNS